MTTLAEDSETPGDHVGHTSDADTQAVQAFETARGSLLRRKGQIYSVSILFCIMIVVWAFHAAGFADPRVGDGALAKAAAFLRSMNPELQVDTLFEDKTTEGSLARWYHRWPQWRAAMIETIEMAIVATAFGSVFGLGAGFLSARTTMPIAAVRWGVKRVLELIRTIPDLILAIIFVVLFGLGPLAGLLTLTLSSIGAMGRFMAETLENIDKRPREAIRAAGGGPMQQIRYGVFPQIFPVFISFVFLGFEIRIASATTLGLVGAGGIGRELTRALDFNQYDSYLAILTLIVFVIVIADLFSEHVRHRISDPKGAT